MKFSTILLTSFTLVAFAANSILCRLALQAHTIGPIEFTIIRLSSGALMLLPLILFRTFFLNNNIEQSAKNNNILKIKFSNFWQAIALFGYALFFSLAYLKLEAGIGALILFPSVQITMMGISVFRGNKVTRNEWVGFGISFLGLIYLMSPGISSPPFIGTMLMIVSGISWGVYSLLGKEESQPILLTARNFLFCIPGVIILGLLLLLNLKQNKPLVMESEGIILAVVSGAITSGVGYVLWYLTLQRISTTVASISQLVVPIIAAIGGIIFLNESLSFRLVIASIFILGGIIITILNRK